MTSSSNIELVYFLFPTCDGNCKHCWSNDLRLGRYQPFSWHEKMIDSLASMFTFKEVKISGGEPFFHKEIGAVAHYFYEKLAPSQVPISIFTSGRPFVSREFGQLGVTQTKENILERIPILDGLCIQMSVDEFHQGVLAQKEYWSEEESNKHFEAYIKNFMLACLELKELNPLFLGPKLKIHCDLGRATYHREQLLSWMSKEWWECYTVLTEGLVRAGNAKTMSTAFEIHESDMVSYFLLPGVDFYDTPLSQVAECFTSLSSKATFLDSSNNSGVLIKGWWNIINRVADYQRIQIAE